MVHKNALTPTVENLKSWYDNGLLDLNPDYQREGNVWDKSRKEKFIFTLINHSTYVIPVIYLNNSSDTQLPHYEVVDGKQRLTTILEYITGRKLDSEGRLTETRSNLKSPQLGDPQYHGKRFSDLDKVNQFSIMNAVIPTVAFQKYEKEVMRDIFAMLQEGVALNQGEKLNALDKAFNRAAKHLETTYRDLLDDIKPKAKRSYWNTVILHLLAIEVSDNKVNTSFKPMKALLTESHHQDKIDAAITSVNGFLQYINEVVSGYEKEAPIAQHFNEVQLVGLFCAWKNGTMNKINPLHFQKIWEQFISDKASLDNDFMKSYKNETLEGSNTQSSRNKRAELIDQYVKEAAN